MKATHTWTTQKGKGIEAEVELFLSRTIWSDGHDVTVPDCRIETTITLEGRGRMPAMMIQPTTIAGVTYPAHCGPLMISEANFSAIQALRDECMASPEWIAKTARDEARAEEIGEYEAGKAIMDNVMAE